MDSSAPIFRFAPSPNGRLHLGHAFSALLNARLAETMHGRFLLRLEDIDTLRCTPELLQHCLDDLAWLGLTWEEPVRIQSQHMDDYAHALERLRTLGLLYPCFCTRSEIAATSTGFDPDGAPLYPGTCAQLPEPERAARLARSAAHAWRLSMPRTLERAAGPHHYCRSDPRSAAQKWVEADPSRWGDPILARKEIPTSYHLSVVVDDALQGITHIVRGKDLEAATDLHVLLQTLLGLPTPLYHFHPLLLAPEGDKLSKSRGSESLADLRARGVTPEVVRARLEPMLA